MPPWMETFITILITAISSSGFWAFLQNRRDRKSEQTKILLGLGHDRIMYLGTKYIERGDWITADEYENLIDYLWTPYSNAKGNGACERIITEVKHKLRIVRVPPTDGR